MQWGRSLNPNFFCFERIINRKRPTDLSWFHSPSVNHWCHDKWHGWGGPAHRGRVDSWSSDGRPLSRHSCPWGFGAPDPAKGLGQSLLCPGNGWLPSHWRCSAGPACPHGGGPAHQSLERDLSLRCFQEYFHCPHWGCSNAGGEDWNDSYFILFLFCLWKQQKKYSKKDLWEKAGSVTE